MDNLKIELQNLPQFEPRKEFVPSLEIKLIESYDLVSKSIVGWLFQPSFAFGGFIVFVLFLFSGLIIGYPDFSFNEKMAHSIYSTSEIQKLGSIDSDLLQDPTSDAKGGFNLQTSGTVEAKYFNNDNSISRRDSLVQMQEEDIKYFLEKYNATLMQYLDTKTENKGNFDQNYIRDVQLINIDDIK